MRCAKQIAKKNFFLTENVDNFCLFQKKSLPLQAFYRARACAYARTSTRNTYLKTEHTITLTAIYTNNETF